MSFAFLFQPTIEETLHIFMIIITTQSDVLIFFNHIYFISFWLGRGGNVWLRPPGCAMFSIHVRVPATSWLGERIPFLQHIMSLAVVLAVRTKPGYEVRM